MANWVFQTLAPNSFTIANLSGSGLGFFAAGGFGSSVSVGAYNDTEYVTDSTGTVQGPMTNNVKYLSPQSGIVNSASSGVPILNIPHYLASFIAEFQHTSPVRMQNVRAYIYDRTNINNPPSGVISKMAQVVNTSTLLVPGSGHTVWQSPAGSSYMPMVYNSPGRSGYAQNGESTIDSYHTFYCLLSESPSSIGSKLHAVYLEGEYL